MDSRVFVNISDVVSMKESIKMLPMYASMFGVPILMVLAVLSYALYPIVFTAVLIPLIAIGLLFFGLIGAREVYLHKYTLKGTEIPYNINRTGEAARAIKDEPNGKKKLVIVIKRFDVSLRKMVVNKYEVGIDRFTTVLDILLHIKSKTDNTLSIRYSCRMGICGSCGMVINGRPMLACETNVLKNAVDDKIEVAPMQAHPLLKDLVDDFDDFFDKHISISPYLYKRDKNEQYLAKKEYKQTQAEIEEFLPYSYCIMCGLCMDACPVVNTNPDFIGPQPLSQVYRYYADSRDEMGDARIEKVDVLEGLWSCEYAGACSKVCPKGVDPATAIQLLKATAMGNLIK